MKKIIYVQNPRCAHEILPLLDRDFSYKVHKVKDILILIKKSKEYGAVIIDSFGRFGILALLVSFLLRIPLIIRLRGEFFREQLERTKTQTGTLRWIRYFWRVSLAKFFFLRSKMVIVNSRYMEQATKSYAKRKLQQVVYLPYIDIHSNKLFDNSLSLPNEGFHILTVINMNLYSKVQPTFDALDKYIPLSLWEELNIYWVICGMGFHYDRFRDLITLKKIEHRVFLPGWVNNMEQVYNWCDVLIHLTRIDAFPNTTMEAMMHNKPVITNVDSCGTREQVFDGLNGFVIEDVVTFLKALSAYAKDPLLRERHGQAGRSLVEERFSVDVQKKAMQEALKQLA
jgi:glycosyltransferase involved in cell wall biosynthesis